MLISYAKSFLMIYYTEHKFVFPYICKSVGQGLEEENTKSSRSHIIYPTLPFMGKSSLNFYRTKCFGGKNRTKTGLKQNDPKKENLYENKKRICRLNENGMPFKTKH